MRILKEFKLERELPMNLKILNKSQLQIIAIIAMVCDHIAFMMPTLMLYFALKTIGRITIVIMSYFVAEGYYKTRNINKYILRMAVFAAISQLPFYLYENALNMPGDFLHFLVGLYMQRNVIFTLLVGLCLLTVWKSKAHIVIKIIAAAFAYYITRSADWRYFCLLWVMAFGMLHGDTRKQMKAALMISLLRFIVCVYPIMMSIADGQAVTLVSFIGAIIQISGVLAIPLLMMYNGKRGNAPRLAFYIFYLAHLMLLYIVKLIMF